MGWGSPSPPHRSAGRSGALDTRRHAFGGPGDWKGGKREAETEFESVSEEARGWKSREPRRGPDRMSFSFVFSFCFFFWRSGEKKIREP